MSWLDSHKPGWAQARIGAAAFRLHTVQGPNHPQAHEPSPHTILGGGMNESGLRQLLGTHLTDQGYDVRCLTDAAN